MPVDPRTGQQLPYPGEPGYEEAMAANPEAYQGEAFPPGGGAAAGPGPGGELPPAGPGAELSPEQAGAPTPEDITDLEDEQAQLTQDIMTEAAPQPEKPYSVKAIGTLIDEFNSTMDSFGAGDLPDITWEAAEGGDKWDQPLPDEIFMALTVLNEALKVVGDGGFFDKYGMELEQLTSDAELRKATANLKKMGKDKKLVEAMSAPMGGEEEPLEETPEPGAFEEDEEMLAANMA